MTRSTRAIWAMLLVGTATGANGQVAADRVVADVTACRAVADDAARLACFDRTAAALSSAREAREIVVMDRAEVREKKRSLFGLQLPDINLFGRNDDKQAEPEVAQIETSVIDAVKFGRDRWTVRLANGSTWRTTEPARFDPRRGDALVIRRAALGSFRGSFAGASAVRMERLR